MEKKLNMKKKSDQVLLVSFVLLLIIVLVLFGMFIKIKINNKVDNNNRITIPIIEKNSNNEIEIDLKEIEDKEIEYIFTITNFKKHDVNKEKLDYDIKIINNNNIALKLYKNDSKENILINNQVLNNHLKIKVKQSDVYKLIIPVLNETEKDENIFIKIRSN